MPRTVAVDPQTGKEVFEWDGEKWVPTTSISERPLQLEGILESTRLGGAVISGMESGMKTLGEEFAGGLRQIPFGVKTLIQDVREGKPEAGLMRGGTTAGLGAVRALFSPLTAGSEFLGETTRKLTEPLGPNISAAAGTAANILTPGAIGRMGLPIIKKGAKMIPGSQAALHEMATETIEKLPGKIRPPIPPSQLYQRAESIGIDIPANKLKQTIDDLLAQESLHKESVRAAPYIKFLEETKAQLTQNPSLTFKEAEALTQDINQLTRAMEVRINQRARGGADVMHGALLDDLKIAGEMTGSRAPELFLQAQKAAQRNFAAERLTTIIENARKPLEGQAGLEKMRYGQLLTQIQKDKLLNRALDATEMKEIKSLLNQYRNLPIIPPPRGGQFGSGRFAGISSGAGLAGFAAGGPIGAAILAPAALVADRVISHVLTSEQGRDLLKKLLQSGPINMTKLNVLTAFVRAESGINFPPPTQEQMSPPTQEQMLGEESLNPEPISGLSGRLQELQSKAGERGATFAGRVVSPEETTSPREVLSRLPVEPIEGEGSGSLALMGTLGRTMPGARPAIKLLDGTILKGSLGQTHSEFIQTLSGGLRKRFEETIKRAGREAIGFMDKNGKFLE